MEAIRESRMELLNTKQLGEILSQAHIKDEKHMNKENMEKNSTHNHTRHASISLQNAGKIFGYASTYTPT